MGGLRSRNKGKRAEREIYHLLQPTVNVVYGEYDLEPPLLERNQMQSHRGGYDIVGLDWMAIEVKHQESFHIKQWWKQTTTQAGQGQVPVLFYRKNHAKWRVMMYGRLEAGSKFVLTPIDITIDSFMLYFKDMVREMLDQKGEE